jgi:hypothetical protein
VRRTKIRPLAQIRFADDDRARFTQARRDERIARRDRLRERERASTRPHLVGRVDVVLDQHRNPVQRTTHFPLLPLCIQLLGDAVGVGV